MNQCGAHFNADYSAICKEWGVHTRHSDGYYLWSEDEAVYPKPPNRLRRWITCKRKSS